MSESARVYAEGQENLPEGVAEETGYTTETIQVLKGLEGVRKRPAMYIGDTGENGLHELIKEIVNNSVDEAMAGYCTWAEVMILEDGSVRIEDDGRGIPVGRHEGEQKSGVEVVMTMLHAGGKFDKKAYQVSGGLHGVGSSVVNALSEWCVAEVCQAGKVHRQRYERGVPRTDLEVVGGTDKTGTIIQFKPDAQIFETVDFDYESISHRLRELAFLNKGMEIRVADERSGRAESTLIRSKAISSWSLMPSPLGVMRVEVKERLENGDAAIGMRTTLELLSTWGAASPGSTNWRVCSRLLSWRKASKRVACR